MCFTFPLEAQAQLNGAEVGCSGKENMSLFPYINAINENIPVIKRFFGEHRKIYADVYIDDQAEIPEWE